MLVNTRYTNMDIVPADCLVEIANRLDSFASLGVFARACHRFRDAAAISSSQDTQAPRIPARWRHDLAVFDNLVSIPAKFGSKTSRSLRSEQNARLATVLDAVADGSGFPHNTIPFIVGGKLTKGTSIGQPNNYNVRGPLPVQVKASTSIGGRPRDLAAAPAVIPTSIGGHLLSTTIAYASAYGRGLHSPPTEVSLDGTQMWNKYGGLHREDDLPALVTTDGRREWWVDGKRHRAGGKPAIVHPNGSREWYMDGRRHNENDEPAVQWADGHREWWANGQRHRDADQPAIIWADGQREWYTTGLRHRRGGPAIIRANGEHEYWIEGHYI
jgi:hypothetical protein